MLRLIRLEPFWRGSGVIADSIQTVPYHARAQGSFDARLTGTPHDKWRFGALQLIRGASPHAAESAHNVSWPQDPEAREQKAHRRPFEGWQAAIL